MKTLLSCSILILTLSGLSAQEADSLQDRSTYQKTWEAATQDGTITADERAMLNILRESLSISADSSTAWETQWTIPVEPVPLKAELDQSGRWPLVLQNIAWGTGLYGWGIPYVLDADDGRWYVGGTMISAGASFYLTYQYTKNMEMTHARTQMMRYGSLLAFRYGLGLNDLLNLYEGENSKAWMWMLMASVPAGHYGGELLFDRYKPSNGQAWAWTMWTAVGGITGRLVYNVLTEEPEYPDYDWGYYSESREKAYDEEVKSWENRRILTELVSYPLGMAAGYYLIQDKQYTFGDALMLIQGWGYGYINTLMLQSLLFDDGDIDVFFLTAGLGGIGGAYLYDRWIRSDDFTFGHSTLMFLGSGSGMAFGFGTAIILDVTDKEPILTLAMAGYGAGTWLTRKILDVKPDGALTGESSTKFSIMPSAMTVVESNNKMGLIPALEINISFK